VLLRSSLSASTLVAERTETTLPSRKVIFWDLCEVQSHTQNYLFNVNSTNIMVSPTGNVLHDTIGCWWDTIILNVHAQTEYISNNKKNSFCEELEHVFDQSVGYYIKTQSGDFNAKVEEKIYFC
jgi:hypothetical protein